MKDLNLYIEMVCCVLEKDGRSVNTKTCFSKVTGLQTKKKLWSAKDKRTLCKRKKKVSWLQFSPQVHLLPGDDGSISTKCRSSIQGFSAEILSLGKISFKNKGYRIQTNSFLMQKLRYCFEEPFLRNLLGPTKRWLGKLKKNNWQ